MSRCLFAVSFLLSFGLACRTSLFAESPAAEARVAGGPTAYTAWRAKAIDAVTRAGSTTGPRQRAALARLVALYQSLDSEPALPADERAYWKRLIGRRLRRAADVLAQRDNAGQLAAWRREGLPPVPAVLRPAAARRELAALGPEQAAAARQAGRPSAQLARLIENVVAPDGRQAPRGILAQQLGPLRQPLGALGPAPAQPPGAPADDYGPELVELIQTTIAPSSWDVNGGLGTIRYFRNLRVLVVRQTGEVHDALGGLIGDLRQ